MDIVLNTADLEALDGFVGGSGQPVPGFGGFMDENFVDEKPGIKRLADMAWKFRGHPYRHNVEMNGFGEAANIDDRIQAATAFLLVKAPSHIVGGEPTATFGWGDDPTHAVPIYPEQFVNVLDPAPYDPFASTVWPVYDNGTVQDWGSLVRDNATARTWLAAHANGLVYHEDISNRDFIIRYWALDDGLPQSSNLVVAVWDVTPGSVPAGTFKLGDLFGAVGVPSTSAIWYKMIPAPSTVMAGGLFATEAVGMTQSIATWENSMNFYFTANVHSPTVSAAASATVPAGLPRTGTLKIAASHWNGMPLSELRADGSQLGWDDDLLLEDGDRDGVYTCTVTNTTNLAVGVHSLPVVAVGNDGLRTYTDVEVEAVAVPDVSIATEVAYPLLAQAHDGKVVLAVDITSFVPLNATTPVEITATTIPGISVPVVLWDDGQAGIRSGAEDATASDGIFTSDRVSGAVNAAGTYTANVVVHPASGNPVSGTVSVTSVLSRAEFEDKTISSGDIAMNARVPRYAMAYANTSSDHVSGEKIMVVTFADAETYPLILKNRSSDGSLADFWDRSNAWLGGGATHLPEGSRGVCFGDFGGGVDGRADGKEDFFLCGATGSHLYVNSGTISAPQFVDVTEAAFRSSADRTRIAGAMSAAWCDFDLDGDLDLFVATSDYSGSMSDIENQNGVAFGGAFFVNDGHGRFFYKNVGIISGSEAGLTGVWAKLVPTGKWPYLVLPWISSGNCMLAYRFDGGPANKTIGVTGEQLSNLNSIAVCDYNHDGKPDLVVTEHAGGGKAAILRNDYNPATGVLSFHVACTFGEGRLWAGATVADFDGNGQDDILLLPESGAPALYMAQSYSTAPEYTDLAFTLGLRAGATSGCVATDQGGSRLPDISLGRAGERVMYQNLRTLPSPHPGRWVEISLGSVGNSNSSLIGTEVTIQQSGKSWTKLVDGGSGRGGQDANSFRFFLEEDTSNVAVSVNYPSGDSDFLASVPVDSVYAVVEDSPVVLKTGTKTNPDPTFSYELGPGTMDWVFRWRTVGIKGVQWQDAVTIENYVGYTDTSPCYMGIEPGTPLVLHWGDPGVTFNIYFDGTDWVHEARWAGLPCATGCQYRFKVTSGIGNGVTTTSTQAKVIPALEFCMPDPDPNQQ